MWKKYFNIFTVIFAIFILFILYSSGANYSQENKFKYVGVKVCAVCHDSEEIGSQSKIWEKSLHAKAFVTLASDRALEQAREAGVDVHPQKSEKCLKCHIPGAGLDESHFAETYKKEEGITCEVCHGPGSAYKDICKLKDREKFLANGGKIPSEKDCLKCHDELSFNFKQKFREIAHLVQNKK